MNVKKSFVIFAGLYRLQIPIWMAKPGVYCWSWPAKFSFAKIKKSFRDFKKIHRLQDPKFYLPDYIYSLNICIKKNKMCLLKLIFFPWHFRFRSGLWTETWTALVIVLRLLNNRALLLYYWCLICWSWKAMNLFKEGRFYNLFKKKQTSFWKNVPSLAI